MSKKKKIKHNDGFVNAFTGQGMRSRDPFVSYSVDAETTMNEEEIDNLYTFNGIAQKIVDAPADDAITEGFKLKNGLDDIEQSELVMSALEDLNWQEVFSEALSWNRAYGGSAVLLVTNDGKPFNEPLEITSKTRIEKLEVFSKQDITDTGYFYSDITSPKYGKPYMYTLLNQWGNSFDVHESRLLLFRGGRLSKQKRRERQGWGASCFDIIKGRLVQYETSMNLSLAALSRLSQSVLKLNGLAEVLSSDGGDTMVQRRLQTIDMARHFLNTIAIDSLDDYQQHGLALGGITQIEEEFECALSAASNIPVTILFGRSPAGMNATGHSDFEQYYKMVKHIQVRDLKPRLLYLIEVLNQINGWKLPDKYTIEFKPLWSMSEQEQASLKQTEVSIASGKVSAINTLVQSEVITKEEARNILQSIINKDDVK